MEECPALGFGCSEHPGTSHHSLSAWLCGCSQSFDGVPKLQPALMWSLSFLHHLPVQLLLTPVGLGLWTSPLLLLPNPLSSVQPMCKLYGREAELTCNLHDLVGTVFSQVQKARLSHR